MIKKVFLSSIILAFLTSSVLAQGRMPFSVYVGGGITIPASPDAFVDIYNTGPHFVGAIGIPVTTGFQILPKVESCSLPLYKDISSEGIYYSGGNFHITMYGIAITLSPDTPTTSTRLRALCGCGIASMEFSDMIVNGHRFSGVSIESEFYFEFGGGIEFKLVSDIALFAQFEYVKIMTADETTDIAPLTVGLKFW